MSGERRHFGAHSLWAGQQEAGKPPSTLDVLFGAWPSISVKLLLCRAEEAGLLAAARAAHQRAEAAAQEALAAAERAGLTLREAWAAERAARERAGVELSRAEAGRLLRKAGRPEPDPDRVAWSVSSRARGKGGAKAGELDREVVVSTALWLAALAMADEPAPEFVATPQPGEDEERPFPADDRITLSSLTLPALRLSPRAAFRLGRIVQLTEPRLTGVEAEAVVRQLAQRGLHADLAGNGKAARGKVHEAAEAWIVPACAKADDVREKNPTLSEVRVAELVHEHLKKEGVTCQPRRKEDARDTPSAERIRKVLRQRGRGRKIRG